MEGEKIGRKGTGGKHIAYSYWNKMRKKKGSVIAKKKKKAKFTAKYLKYTGENLQVNEVISNLNKTGLWIILIFCFSYIMLLKTERGILNMREIPSGNACEGQGREGGAGEVKS